MHQWGKLGTWCFCVNVYVGVGGGCCEFMWVCPIQQFTQVFIKLLTCIDLTFPVYVLLFNFLPLYQQTYLNSSVLSYNSLEMKVTFIPRVEQDAWPHSDCFVFSSPMGVIAILCVHVMSLSLRMCFSIYMCLSRNEKVQAMFAPWKISYI